MLWELCLQLRVLYGFISAQFLPRHQIKPLSEFIFVRITWRRSQLRAGERQASRREESSRQLASLVGLQIAAPSPRYSRKYKLSK